MGFYNETFILVNPLTSFLPSHNKYLLCVFCSSWFDLYIADLSRTLSIAHKFMALQMSKLLPVIGEDLTTPGAPDVIAHKDDKAPFKLLAVHVTNQNEVNQLGLPVTPKLVF